MALQDDLNLVMGHVLAIAHMVLGEKAALTPFAVVMTTGGEVLQISGEDGSEPVDVIERLTTACRTKAQAGEYKAVAIAYDVRIEQPGAPGLQDAVAVNFDHRENASVVYCLPYGYNNGEIELSEPLTDQGENLIFGADKPAGGEAGGSGIIMPD